MGVVDGSMLDSSLDQLRPGVVVPPARDLVVGVERVVRFRNLRIFLKQERKLYVIEQPFPIEPFGNASRADRDAHKKHLDDMVDVGCLMLATMNPELQKQHEDMCKLAEGSPVGPHVLKMIGYIESLFKLGFPLGQELATDVILQSLPDSYNQFVLNFNMNEIDKTLP
ncbi:uncharacterized protein LOC108471409 [Gossypium arboreum]|uniref:uncharacterized protein LOC108471409 n=1 Tax=Gossypium arboreum TaxID=29729 RepID=UPI00081949EA|nr:uncharacterized protein LOC108471409 [Gossypium arboreum]